MDLDELHWAIQWLLAFAFFTACAFAAFAVVGKMTALGCLGLE